MSMAKPMCRTCGGFACPKTSSNLFAEDQKELLEYIKRTCNLTIRPLPDLPTLICKNCEAEVIFPGKFIKRCANAQFFFSTNAYREKLNLMEQCCNYDKNWPVSSIAIEEQPTNNLEKENATSKDSSSDENDFGGVSILTPRDALKPRKRKGKNRKAPKRELYKCEQCDQLIIDRHNFISHMKRHLGVKPFQCEFCPNKYFTNSELKRHNYRHINYRPHKCRYCDATYYTKQNKDRHERLHTGEQPYICETCGRAFAGRRNLRRHVMTHTEEKSFKCLPCNKSFRRANQLNIHYLSRTHKNIDIHNE